MTQTGSMHINDIEVRYMVAPSLRIQKSIPYVDVFNLMDLTMKMARSPLTNEFSNPPNLLLTGPAGGGKTMLCMAIAKTLDAPILVLDCSEETRERHIKGGFVAKDGETPFILGTVANAIHVANEHGIAVLVLEELNTLSNQVQKLLNPVLDFRKKLEVPEISSRFSLNDGATLLVYATANPTTYGGTYDLNDDLKSRFVEIELPYPSPVAEKSILRAVAPVGYNFDDQVFDILVNIARETRQGGTRYSLSTRDLAQALDLLARLGWEETLFLLSQKFSGQDRTLFLDRVRDITGQTILPIRASVA